MTTEESSPAALLTHGPSMRPVHGEVITRSG